MEHFLLLCASHMPDSYVQRTIWNSCLCEDLVPFNRRPLHLNLDVKVVFVSLQRTHPVLGLIIISYQTSSESS